MNARAHKLGPGDLAERHGAEFSSGLAGVRAATGGMFSANIRIDGRRTSLRLEPEMWSALNEVAEIEGRTIHDICTAVAALPRPGNASLTSSVRVFLLQYFRAMAMRNRPRGRLAAPFAGNGALARTADLG